MCDNEENAEDMKGPVTIMDLAKFRGVKESETGGITMGAFYDVGLDMMGGCQRCGACIAAYNACPSKTGYWMCASGCIGSEGFDTVEEANLALFPEEYEWKGVKASKSEDEG